MTCCTRVICSGPSALLFVLHQAAVAYGNMYENRSEQVSCEALGNIELTQPELQLAYQEERQAWLSHMYPHDLVSQKNPGPDSKAEVYFQ